MKVVHLVGGELTGGAARGAYWLHRGLLILGIDSSVITTSRQTFDDQSVESLIRGKSGRIKNILRRQLDKALTWPYRSRGDSAFSTGLFGGRVSNHPWVRDADIINMHWVAQGPIGLNDVANLHCPVVYTMRDMWPFTGGCHYSLGCGQYQAGCGQCPQLGSQRRLDLSRLVAWKKRRTLPGNLTVVGISAWLSECARGSTIFAGKDVKTISNCVDTSLFFPIDKSSAREALGIITKKKVILVGANSLNDNYKGFDLFLETMTYLSCEEYLIMIFGKVRPELVGKLKQEIKELGFIADNISLRLAYSAADVFIAPSRMEAFGKTLVEAMACRTPVVCFDATGPRDIVMHGKTGYKAKPFDPQDMAVGVKWVLENNKDDRLGMASMDRARSTFDKEEIARQYLLLYEHLLSRESTQA